MRIYFLLSLFCCFAACTSSKENTAIDSFKKTYTTPSHTQILKDNINATSLFVVDTLLIAKNNMNSEYAFSLFHTKDLKFITHFGKQGEGPTDFETGTSYMGQYLYKNDQLYTTVFEFNKHKFSLINISETILQNKTVIEKELYTQPKVDFNFVFYINDSELVGNSSNLDLNMSKLRFYDPSIDSITKDLGLFPKIENTNKDLEFIQYTYHRLYTAYLGIKPDKSKLVSVGNRMGRVEIFNLQGELEASILDGKENNFTDAQEYASIKNEDKKTYYEGLFTSNKFIYTSYAASPMYAYWDGEIQKCEIRIFDWKGNKKAQISINEPLYSIAVDEKQGVLYAMSRNEKILKYDIKHILAEIN